MNKYDIIGKDTTHAMKIHMKSNHGNDATINAIEIIQWQLFLFEGVYPIIDS